MDDPDPLRRMEAQESQAAEDKAVADVLRTRERDALRVVMGTTEGRFLLSRWAAISGTDAGGCHRGELTHETSFALGRASFGTWVLNQMLNHQPDLWIQATREVADLTQITRDQLRTQSRNAGR